MFSINYPINTHSLKINHKKYRKLSNSKLNLPATIPGEPDCLTILIDKNAYIPLPVDAPDYSGACEYAPGHHLLALPPRFHHHSLTAPIGHTHKPTHNRQAFGYLVLITLGSCDLGFRPIPNVESHRSAFNLHMLAITCQISLPSAQGEKSLASGAYLGFFEVRVTFEQS